MVKLLFHVFFSSICCSYCFPLVKSCPILCKSMDCSMQGFSVFHYLLKFAQIPVLWASDAIQPSHLLLPSSSFAFNLSQYQGLLQWVTSLHQVAKVLVLQLQYQPSPAPQYESINSSALRLLYGPALTSVHDYWKNHRFGIFRSLLAKWCLCFCYVKFVNALLPSSKPLLILRLQSPCSDFGTQREKKRKQKKTDTPSTFSPSICHEEMGLDAMILGFWMLSLKPAFPLPSFTLIKRFFSSSLLFFLIRCIPCSASCLHDLFILFFNINVFILMKANYFTILYWFCHTLTWICHRCPRVPHPGHPSLLLPHPIPLGHPSAPALSTLSHASHLDWRFVSHFIIHMFQCHSPKPSHPCPLPQSPKDCSIHCVSFAVLHTGLSLPSF